MELLQQLVQDDDDPLKDSIEVAQLSRKRFCLLYFRSMTLIVCTLFFLFLTLNTKDWVEALHLYLNQTRS